MPVCTLRFRFLDSQGARALAISNIAFPDDWTPVSLEAQIERASGEIEPLFEIHVKKAEDTPQSESTANVGG